MLRAWKSLPERVRQLIVLAVKAIVTVGAFYLLLTHRIPDGHGGRVSILDEILRQVGRLDLEVFLPFVIAATLIKFVGIFSSMVRWHLLLIGQGIRFNFFHLVGSFLIGRFLGTFLPSTVGLDSYKLYDAARFSKRVVEPAAATAVEKVMGFSGVFLTFLVALPLGVSVLEEKAAPVAAVTVPLALFVVAGLFLTLFRPGIVQWMLRLVPAFGRRRIESFIQRVSKAATAYRGKGKLLATVVFLSFSVHFCTAAMYYFTALAVGAAHADFWQVTFASSIQIFATVISPFTIGGEGIREIVQAILLTKHIGAGESVLSAALGFWAAEAMTLVGAFFLWGRGRNYRPKKIELSEDVQTAAPASDAKEPSAAA